MTSPHPNLTPAHTTSPAARVHPRKPGRLPAWLRRPLGGGALFNQTAAAVETNRLHTICEEARCPNRGECWSVGTATFLILGDACTRRCAFCNVKDGIPRGVVDAGEPARLAEAVARMGLRYVVITSVDRDDLADKGAGHFVRCVEGVRAAAPGIGIELLTPDFRRAQAGAVEVIGGLAAQGGFVWGHHVETVPLLYRAVRPGAEYVDSLALLRGAAGLRGVEAKSSLMLGLGETREEVLGVLDDLRAAGVKRITLGQYLQPTTKQLAVEEYIEPEVFDEYAAEAYARGFAWVMSGPFVRSSYRAEVERTRGETRGVAQGVFLQDGQDDDEDQEKMGKRDS